MPKYQRLFFFSLPVLVSFILHFRVLNLDVMGYHVWRQAQTQTVIYHFTFSDNNIFHPQKFDLRDGSPKLLYEFPVYQWLIAQVDRLIGYSVANSRIFTFLVFILLLAGFYFLIRFFVSEKIALITNALLCFSPLLYYYCVNPMPDLMALACSVWALYFFFSLQKTGTLIDFFLFSFFILLATLIKLPYVIFSSVWLPHLIRTLKEKKISPALKEIFIYSLCITPAIIWYVNVIPTWANNPVVKGIAGNEKSMGQLFDYLQFTLISSIPELLTNYASCIFLIAGIFAFFKNFGMFIRKYPAIAVLFLATSAYYFFEMSAIEKTHDYYLMPFLPLLFLLVALGIKSFFESRWKWLVYLVIVLVPLTAWLRIDHRWDAQAPGFAKDYLNKQEYFQSIIPKESKCIIDDDDSRFISLYYLKRSGFSFNKNELNEENLMACYATGADILVTENPAFNPGNYPSFVFTELYRGELRIFKIRKV